ncbi:MAG TPA: cytochrome P450, partial [Gemmatimonadales bacterium]|nr:cytochrome P450 [Gemmatimonadales bacterium]
MRDLWRWTRDPLGLLEQGASTGPVFKLRLWRTIDIGYHPAWNKAVLTDLDTFRSAGSLSGLTPYLDGGVVQLDSPEHDPRRRELNPSFHDRALHELGQPMAAALAETLPRHDFDALRWSGTAVRAMLNAAFFGGAMPTRLLEAFLHPLERPLPHPLARRPLLFHRIDRIIKSIVDSAPGGTLAGAIAGLPGAAEELRVALAAGYDTTAHTLAWAIWLLAEHPRWQDPGALPRVIDEVLRLYPSGWLGSRVVSRDVELEGVPLKKGTLVGYSPYLTHRDPALWDAAAEFRPDRFDKRPEPWSYLP